MAVHVLPLNDDREHTTEGQCWCQPEMRWQDAETGEIYANGPMVIHNAADCREVSELVTGERMADGKTWKTIEA